MSSVSDIKKTNLINICSFCIDNICNISKDNFKKRHIILFDRTARDTMKTHAENSKSKRCNKEYVVQPGLQNSKEEMRSYINSGNTGSSTETGEH